MSVCVGIDVHRKRSQLAVVDATGEVLANRNVPNGVEPILKVIGGLPPGTPAASGAAFGTGWLAGAARGLRLRGGDPRRPVLALALIEQPRDLGFEPLPPRCPRRQLPAPPLVKPGLGHSQRPAGHRLRDTVTVPLGSDEPGHGYLLPIAS